MSVCESCPTAKMATSSMGADVMQFAGKAVSKQTMANPSKKSTACPNCGFTKEDFKEKGRLGCSECYHTFAEGLSKVLEKVQRGLLHKGKGSPGVVNKDPLREIAALKERLQELVLTEEYEEAAKLRDQIRELESC
ncbi:UvrB/UvrC motif-containing protein [Puniceicoccaceae bacterium K14]|nr:UvrB/UvrC motif-containing protein [Puniceicoccaceae bacterium K14]